MTASLVVCSENPVLALRACNAYGSSYNGFRWPLEVGAIVSAPDWEQTNECGHGLHGLLWGCGAGEPLMGPTGPWLVVEVAEYVKLNGKIKFPSCVVRHVGDRQSATQFIHAVRPGAIVGLSVVVSGYRETATTGDYGTATAGHHGRATAGNYGRAKAGAYGRAMAGDYGEAEVGDHGEAHCGYHGTANAGIDGTAIAGDHGTAIAGDYGTAHAGDSGRATAGYRGTAIAGNHGTAQAGDFGIIQITYLDDDPILTRTRARIAIGYVGENGIEVNTPYIVKNGQLVKKGDK